MMISALHILLVTVFGLEWRHLDATDPEIRLTVDDSCRSAAKIEWLVLTSNEELTNCTIFYDTAENFSKGLAHSHDTLRSMTESEAFIINGLKPDRNYSVGIICSSVLSEVLTFNVSDSDCSTFNKDDTTPTNEVVVFKEQTSFLGTRDSVLGIVFGLFGLLIIIVTSFYVLRKVRRRQRLERIRRYLGSSLIDPFQNMEDREPSMASERLIEENTES